MASAIYLHIPFCEQICYYCDFNKFFLKNQPVDEYIAALRQEIQMYAAQHHPEEPITSIYIGGGTPTSISTDQLAQVIEGLSGAFPLSPDAEITVEVNPGSCSDEKMAMLKKTGVNRLSIGVQTFDPELLKAINRDHHPIDAKKTVELARSHGINDLSVDLMFGLPNQTMEQWNDTLKQAFELPVTHISAYSLKVEPKTVFYQWERQGRLDRPTEDLEADMYNQLVSGAVNAGFQQYEISNFARGQYQSRHNLVYWNNQEYYGFGAGAHGYLNGERYANHGPLPKYLKAMESRERPTLHEHPVPLHEQKEEFMFMGLRKISGISLEEYQSRYGEQVAETFPGVMDELVKEGLLVMDEDSVRLSSEGKLLGNQVFEKFLLGN
ncbi:radical SAM family heme chaperone HemW [Salisediminibacterium beveridgei]|uniref:Heme chaperone HemW n=1 Tax=Salisediminibacterium beveridgei TaxID=632773 RepID=A0A1D7QUB6_9BACI|nr:radical SAM family heme chaperone HemW [Salisediminibacterium beveridgei]AOM82575.1 Putative coproporphyrinogen III oxidase of BS HemN-type, oxygen-independent [Salisediminibacterium beveridgei]